MSNAPDLGKLILRLALGSLILLHGINKLLGGVGGIVSMVANTGLPGVLGYGVIIGEVIAPLLIMTGFHARIGGWLVAINMLFALWLVHGRELLALNEHGGWEVELQAMYLVTAVAVALLGAGRYAIKPGS